MYKIKFKKSSIKQFGKLPTKDYEAMFEGLMRLVANPANPSLDVIKLKGQNRFRLRVGAFRALYTLNHEKKEVNVSAVLPRRDAYKKK